MQDNENGIAECRVNGDLTQFYWLPEAIGEGTRGAEQSRGYYTIGKYQIGRKMTYNVPTNTVARAFELRNSASLFPVILIASSLRSNTGNSSARSIFAVNVCFPRLFLQHLRWPREMGALLRFATIPPSCAEIEGE